MTVSRGRTALFQQHGPYLVFVHSRESPDDDEWSYFLDEIRTKMQAGRFRIFVYTEGGAPNARQRALLNELLAGSKPPISIVTSSQVARAVGTALSWFQPRIRIFSPDEFDKAFLHLEATPADQARLKGMVTVLRRELAAQQNVVPPPSARSG